VDGCPVCARLTGGRCAAHAFSILPDAPIVNPDYVPLPANWPNYFPVSAVPVHTCLVYDSDGITILRKCQSHCQCPCHHVCASAASPAEINPG
jgi:hypothetical protein